LDFGFNRSDLLLDVNRVSSARNRGD